MNRTVVIQGRATPVLRDEAQKHFDSIGLTLVNAIRRFRTQSVQSDIVSSRTAEDSRRQPAQKHRR